MYPDDDMLADDGYVELPPPPDNPNAGFWYLGALQLVLVFALAAYMFATKPLPELEPALDGIILSAIEPAPIGAVVSTPDVASPVEVPIPRMREIGDAPPQGWVLDREDQPTPEAGNTSRDFAIHANRDIDGGDYASLKNVSHEQCADRCKSDSRCRAYTYNTWEKVCFVKSSLSALRIEPRGLTGVIASEKVGDDKRPAVIQMSRSRYFPGVPYRQVLAPAYGGCAKACLDDAACLGFNYSKASRSCALMASLDKPVSGSSTDLGIKLQGARVAAAGRRTRYASRPPELAIFEAVLDGVFGH
jgi:hypothetical protein